MSEKKIIVKNENTPAFEKRRKLLKASAVSPLIATLPSGVAQATASAFQCIGGDFSVRHTCPVGVIPSPDGALDSPNWLNGKSCGSDEAERVYLRVYYEPIEVEVEVDGILVMQKRCPEPHEAQLLYKHPVLPDLYYGEGHGGVYSGGYSIPELVGWVDPPAEDELCSAGSSEVLVMFEVSADGTTVEAKGVWPEIIESEEHHPITGSCLTSIVEQNGVTDDKYKLL